MASKGQDRFRCLACSKGAHASWIWPISHSLKRFYRIAVCSKIDVPALQSDGAVDAATVLDLIVGSGSAPRQTKSLGYVLSRSEQEIGELNV